MSEIVIRPATQDERNWSASLLAGSEPWITLGTTLEQCMKTCHDEEYRVFIAIFGPAPCGVIVIDPRGLAGSPYIKSVVVAKEFRSQGVGAALLNFAEEWLRNNAKHLFLCVSSFNMRARKFYENHGFNPVGELKDYLIPGASEIIMVKNL